MTTPHVSHGSHAHSYEVEIKSLLGSKENADELKAKLKKRDPSLLVGETEKQLNHYFNNPTDLAAFAKAVADLVPHSKKESFTRIMEHGKKLSIRTRDANGTVLLVLKASVGSDTSSNGVQRIECEFEVKKSLKALDKILLDAGCTYQAKWSRERETYQTKDMAVCIDKNAGYGYLAEFEKVTQDESALANIKEELLATMKSLGVAELPQDRLERMFAHYNAHWPEYYGTDKTFTLE